MLNELHARFHDPHNGFDPISQEHAEAYAAPLIARPDVISIAANLLGDVRGKTVLDLGAGPGHYSLAFAKLGARVTWHDISKNYRRIAERKALDAGVDIEFSLGYLEDAVRLPAFDLVFNSLCWRYCMNEKRFARIIYGLIRPGGAAYVSEIPLERSPRHPAIDAMQRLGLKIGHPCPPLGRIPSLFRALGANVNVTGINSTEITTLRKG